MSVYNRLKSINVQCEIRSYRWEKIPKINKRTCTTIPHFRVATLECGINMPARLLIFKVFSQQHALILHSVFIHSNIFDQKYQKFMFFRLQYAHFWALILVSIKFSRRHVYYFHKLFQQACLFRQARLFGPLESLIFDGSQSNSLTRYQKIF